MQLRERDVPADRLTSKPSRAQTLYMSRVSHLPLPSPVPMHPPPLDSAAAPAQSLCPPQGHFLPDAGEIKTRTRAPVPRGSPPHPKIKSTLPAGSTSTTSLLNVPDLRPTQLFSSPSLSWASSSRKPPKGRGCRALDPLACGFHQELGSYSGAEVRGWRLASQALT